MKFMEASAVFLIIGRIVAVVACLCAIGLVALGMWAMWDM